jgi:hypothetical protein
MVFYDFLFHAMSYEPNLAFTKLAILFRILLFYLENIFDYDGHWLFRLMVGENYYELAQSINEFFFRTRYMEATLQ